MAFIDEVLDPHRLEDVFDNDRTAVAELLCSARGTEAGYITNLRRALLEGDLAAVAYAAHSIKGSASNIGAASLSRNAAEIESKARLNARADIPALANQLDRQYADLASRISAYIAADGG